MLTIVLTDLKIAGVLFGVVVFLLGNVLVSAAPDLVHDTLKPVLCANGHYSTHDGSGSRSTDCVQPNGQRYSIDVLQFGVILASALLPIIFTWGLAWAVAFFRPRGLSESNL